MRSNDQVPILFSVSYFTKMNVTLVAVNFMFGTTNHLEWNASSTSDRSIYLQEIHFRKYTDSCFFFFLVGLFVRVARLPVMNSFHLVLLFQTRSPQAWQIAEEERMISRRSCY